MRPHKRTLSTVVTGMAFLGALVMGVPWIIASCIYRHENTTETTKWVLLGYGAFFLLFVGIITPFVRMVWKFLRISNTSPLDAVVTVLICIVSAVPLAIVWGVALPTMRFNFFGWKYAVYNHTISITLFLVGALVRHIGELPPEDEQYIMVANHVSPLDYELASQAAGRKPWNIVAGINLRKSNKTIGDKAIAATIGRVVEEHSIFVDRSDEQSKVLCLRRIIKEIDEGKNIVIFPEGTRTIYKNIVDNKILLQEFWDSIFKIAYEKSIPIKPVVFDWPVIWRGKADPRFGLRPCVINTHYLPMIYPKDFSSFEEMKKYCWNLMYSKLAASKKVKRFLNLN